MSSEATCPITLTVAGDPRLARLVRMTAANVGALCSMSVDRIEDIRMAAEEAFIFGCTAVDSDDISIKIRRRRIPCGHDLYLWRPGDCR